MKGRLPNVPCPGSNSDAPLPAGGVEEVTGFQFIRAIFDTFGGCFGGTAGLFMSYTKRVA